MPNAIAYVVLLSWPLVAIVLFSALRKHSIERAILCVAIWPNLFLPQRVAIDLPAIPPLDRLSIPSLVLFLLLVGLPKTRISFLPKHPVGRILLIMFYLSPVATALTNPDTIAIGGGIWLPGSSPYDAISDIIRNTLVILPFVIGYNFLTTEKAHREFLRVVVMLMLVYSVIIVFENRMSPQLHTWIYGFFQHSFAQHIRGGFFRPIGFTQHGLYLAFVVMQAAAAAAILWQATRPGAQLTDRSRGFYLMACLYLFGMLVLCWSMGSLIFALLIVPVLLLTGRRVQLTLAAVFVLFAVSYPALRGAGWVPVEWFVEQAAAISENRARSLGYRFENEDVLLERASERALFGWGGWGRSAIYDPFDGEKTSVPDGYWIIVIGIQGWLGFVAKFGLLALPVVLIFLRMRRHGAKAVPVVTAGICLMMGINMIELLPNATRPVWIWMIAGALLGYAERPASQETPDPGTDPAPRAPPRRRTVL